MLGSSPGPLRRDFRSAFTILFESGRKQMKANKDSTQSRSQEGKGSYAASMIRTKFNTLEDLKMPIFEQKNLEKTQSLCV